MLPKFTDAWDTEIVAERHRELSCTTVVMKPANSLPADEPLRHMYLSAPMVRNILGDWETPSLPAKKA